MEKKFFSSQLSSLSVSFLVSKSLMISFCISHSFSGASNYDFSRRNSTLFPVPDSTIFYQIYITLLHHSIFDEFNRIWGLFLTRKFSYFNLWWFFFFMELLRGKFNFWLRDFFALQLRIEKVGKLLINLHNFSIL